MKKHLALLFVCLRFFCAANDGAYYASGNQLVPVFETTVSVKKEILTVKKINGKFIQVTVYYEFFNPDAAKEIVVGFEAFAPQGDVDPTPYKGQHPYMHDFTVAMNGNPIPYEIALVHDSIETENGAIKSADTVESHWDEFNPFYYIYHFKAKFESGINKVVHTYNYEISSSVGSFFRFDYILTAANRWANRQIDDFTLILDLGECEEYNIEKTFFNDPSDWIVNGIGKIANDPTDLAANAQSIHCVVQNGNLIFQKTNFHPKGELSVWLSRYTFTADGEVDFISSLPYSYYYQPELSNTKMDESERLIMRNLPYARRGYIFKNDIIQQFYSQQKWYIPNTYYRPNLENLHSLELEWIEKLKRKDE